MATPCGYQQITDVSASIGLNVPTPGGPAAAAGNVIAALPGVSQAPTYARIIAFTQGVRWRDDGIAPTATVGQPLAAGSELRYDGDLRKIRFFQQTASAELNVVYYY